MALGVESTLTASLADWGKVMGTREIVPASGFARGE